MTVLVPSSFSFISVTLPIYSVLSPGSGEGDGEGEGSPDGAGDGVSLSCMPVSGLSLESSTALRPMRETELSSFMPPLPPEYAAAEACTVLLSVTISSFSPETQPLEAAYTPPVSYALKSSCICVSSVRRFSSSVSYRAE